MHSLASFSDAQLRDGLVHHRMPDISVGDKRIDVHQTVQIVPKRGIIVGFANVDHEPGHPKRKLQPLTNRKLIRIHRLVQQQDHIHRNPAVPRQLPYGIPGFDLIFAGQETGNVDGLARAKTFRLNTRVGIHDQLQRKLKDLAVIP
ncbi:hypothetical protein D3C81_1637790 [compost metagenome]